MKTKRRNLVKKLTVFFVMCFLFLDIGFANEIVTRCGYVEGINLKELQIVVDGEIYLLSKKTSIFLCKRSASLSDVKKGDFVILSIEKHKGTVKHILIQNNSLE